VKVLAMGPVTGVIGRPLKIPRRDPDGLPVWKNEEKTELETEDANPVNLIKQVILSIPNQMQAPSDSLRATRLWSQLDGVQNAHLELEDKEYEWLHRLLSRQLPRGKEEKDANMEPQTLAVKLFGLNAFPVRQALTEIDSKTPSEE